MAKVRMQNMAFYGFHGFYEYEREQGLMFFFDVEIETKDDKVAETDLLEDGVDPARIYDLIQEVVEVKRFQMLESLAAHIGDVLLGKFGHFAKVTTTVRKKAVPIHGTVDFVEVEVERVAK